MRDYLQSLENLTNEFVEDQDKNSIQFINIELNGHPPPFKGMFIIIDSRRALIPSKMPFEMAILISFTYLTPLGKQLEALMSKAEVFESFDHKLVGKTSSYVMKTGNDVSLIVTTIQKIVDSVFSTINEKDIEVRINRAKRILGYLTDPG